MTNPLSNAVEFVDDLVEEFVDELIHEFVCEFVDEFELGMLIMKFGVKSGGYGFHAAFKLSLRFAAVSSVIGVTPCDDAAVFFEGCEGTIL